MKFTAHTDGASKGNPGPSAFGYTIEQDGAVIEERGEYLGMATNNIAEYRAFIAVMRRMLELGATDAVIYSDSQLAVRQISGVYRVRNEGLIPLYEEIRRLRGKFHSLQVVHVPREENSTADGLANKAIKEHRTGAQE
jgi:ribonuclease HI